MKKILGMISCIMLLIMCFAFTGCGGSEADATKYADNPYLGQWSAEVAEYNGNVFSVKELLGQEFKMELNADGSVRLQFGDKDKVGAWEPTGDGIRLSEDQEMTFIDKDGDLTIDYGGVTLIFEKQ